LGEGLTEAEIVRWLVQTGDVVAVDQPVVEVETAKAVVEIPCPYGGVVTALFGDAGEEILVGRPLLTVAVGPQEPAASGEEPPGVAGPAAEGSGNVLVGYGTAAPGARRRRVRPDRAGGSAAAAGPGSGAGVGARRPPVRSGAVFGAESGMPAPDDPAEPGRRRPEVSARPAAAAGQEGGHGGAGDGPVAVISPLVRRIAREHGVDLRTLAGTGPEGLILRADVERAVAETSAWAYGSSASTVVRRDPADEAREVRLDGLALEAAPPWTPPSRRPGQSGPVDRPVDRPVDTEQTAPGGAGAAAGLPGGAPGAVGARIPLRGIRGAVAAKLSRSRREIPDATCWVDADATELLAARAAMNAGAGPKVSVLALLARICAAALARYPELNSTVDSERNEIVRLPAVHLGFAAQTERGLVVPVVRDAHARTTDGLSAEIGRLTEAARTGSLKPAELTGGTFTLNNYGVFGVDGSTPIINHPEAAMLGVGRIAPKPWVHQGELAVRQVVQLSLTFDHRVCDGGAAGGFLRFVADCVEQPAMLLRAV
jgi:pyruvate dehydrogenase E2 component (dihydrolipoamide acetyltransferase)